MPSRLFEVRHYVLGGKGHPEAIDLDHFAKACRVTGLGPARRCAQSGIGENDIQPAKPRDRLGDRAFHRGGIGDIAFQSQGVLRAEFINQRRQLVDSPAGERHLVTRLHGKPGADFADAGRSAGYKNDFRHGPTPMVFAISLRLCSNEALFTPYILGDAFWE